MDAPLDREAVMKYLRELPLDDRLDVVTEILVGLKGQVAQEKQNPLRSLRGLWKGVSISAEEIDEARREMWSNFPRDDIA
jgi:hypothetical protein